MRTKVALEVRPVGLLFPSNQEGYEVCFFISGEEAFFELMTAERLVKKTAALLQDGVYECR